MAVLVKVWQFGRRHLGFFEKRYISGMRRSDVATYSGSNLSITVRPALKYPLLNGSFTLNYHKVLNDDIMLYRRRLETRD